MSAPHQVAQLTNQSNASAILSQAKEIFLFLSNYLWWLLITLFDYAKFGIEKYGPSIWNF